MLAGENGSVCRGIVRKDPHGGTKGLKNLLEQIKRSAKPKGFAKTESELESSSQTTPFLVCFHEPELYS